MTTDSNPTDLAAIRAVIDAWTGAIGAKDAAGVLRQQAAGFRQFSLAPPLVSDDGAAGLEAWFATWRGPIGYVLHDPAISVGGDVAVCHGLARMTGTKTDGETPDLWFRVTLCFVRQAGDWKIAHEHESVPFYMDGSFKAAVDLKP